MIRSFIFGALGALALARAFRSPDSDLLDKFEKASFEACMGDFYNATWTVTEETMDSEEFKQSEFEAAADCGLRALRGREVLAMILRER